jgi:hypothetical protein
LRRHVRRRRRTPVYEQVPTLVRQGVTEFGRGMGRTCSCSLTAKTTRTTDEDGRLVFKEELSRGLVPGLDEGRDGSGLALVQDFEQPASVPGVVSGAWRPDQSS